MTPDEFKTAIDSAVGAKVALTYPQLALFVLLSGAAAFLGAFLSEKAKNLATKMDIRSITEKIESVRSFYAEQLKRAENAFALAASSHMAQMAFDKHVEFCETYVARVYEGFGSLFQQGPTKCACKIATDLHGIRLRFVLWETEDVALRLGEFEKALWDIGNDKDFLQYVADENERAKLDHRIYEKFNELMGLQLKTLPDKPTSKPISAIAITNIIAYLQSHLGSSKLANLRKNYLDEALKEIKLQPGPSPPSRHHPQ
jgi:hypothetical protein